jgi:hypothetical protein
MARCQHFPKTGAALEDRQVPFWFTYWKIDRCARQPGPAHKQLGLSLIAMPESAAARWRIPSNQEPNRPLEDTVNCIEHSVMSDDIVADGQYDGLVREKSTRMLPMCLRPLSALVTRSNMRDAGWAQLSGHDGRLL